MKCMQTNFHRRGLSGFGDFALFVASKMAKFPFQTIDYSLKKQNRLKIFVQVEVDVKCMQTNFHG